MTWTIQPVEVGRRHADTSVFMLMTDHGKEIQIAYRLWVLRGPAGLLLVDTGPPLEEAHRRGITDVRAIAGALREAGVEPAEVRTIILTHLHWDHASNAEHFPSATFLAQQGEIRFFCSCSREHPSFNRFFSHQVYLHELIEEGRVQPLDGDVKLFDGISVMRVGGHTPGSQMVAVETEDGTEVITGDAIPLNRNYVDDIPSGIVVDTIEAIAAIQRVRDMNPVAIHTGHDLQPRLALRQQP